MAFGKNYAEIVGHLGGDVIVNHLASGGRVANLSVATDESYFNKSGEKVDQTEWHRVVTFQDGLISMLERHAKKGRFISVEGKLRTRRWRREGEDLRPLLDRDPGRAGQPGPILRQAEPRQRQRRPGRARPRRTARRCRPAAIRRRPMTSDRIRFRSEGPFLPPNSGGCFGGRPFFLQPAPSPPPAGFACALRAARIARGRLAARRSRSTPMGRYRTDLTFQLAAPDEVRVYRSGEYIGDIFKDEDVLCPGRFHFIIWLAERLASGWKRVTDRRRLRHRDGAMGRVPSVLSVSGEEFGRAASRPGFPLKSPLAGARVDNRSIPLASASLRPLRAALGRDGCQAGDSFRTPCRAEPPMGSVQVERNTHTDVLSNCATRARASNPAGPPLRSGLTQEALGRTVKVADREDRGAIFRTKLGATFPAPAPPKSFTRARCSPCARVSQQEHHIGDRPRAWNRSREIVMTFDIDTFESAEQSATATVCENAALFGAAPERGEFDSRDVWDATTPPTR